jgi:hypothetical protein
MLAPELLLVGPMTSLDLPVLFGPARLDGAMPDAGALNRQPERQRER